MPKRKTCCRTKFRTDYRGFLTQVEVGVDEGLKHDSAILCDDLISIQKSLLTDYIGSLSSYKMQEVNSALRIAWLLGNAVFIPSFSAVLQYFFKYSV